MTEPGAKSDLVRIEAVRASISETVWWLIAD